ncbi:transcription activator [Histoplasma capsulatum var. duboisii H88]|uniref:Transcription activator n=1 Tax=Ajellomyces capsulatus (strain H88) TaxID=544711 RepID=F0U9J2_AJEC8|nr:transcription activator [Histoplasma capsulatum var. duboisii H88]
MEGTHAALPMKQVCDNCRRRKLKCNRLCPCDRCQGALLRCTYTDILQRKGPKFRTFYPRSSTSSTGDESPQPNPIPTPPNSIILGDFDPGLSQTAHSFFSPGPRISPDDSGCEDFPKPQSPPSRLSAPVIVAHVNVYLKYLFPIMPVFSPAQVLADSGEPERLSPQRYAFLVALCAATHIQLKLDGPTDNGQSDEISGEDLLSEALRARSEYDLIETPSIDSLLTSFYLFASYGNLDKQDHAWYYLCQALFMAHTLGLHQESSYRAFDLIEAEERRRVFWLLFVTERAYALQQTKPVVLRNSIRKPEIFSGDDPILAYGFLNLINLFEKLTPDLYDWIIFGQGDELSGQALVNLTLRNLSYPISLEGVLETQQVDILVTQQWLRTAMWRLPTQLPLDKSPPIQDIILPHVPIKAGKLAMEVVCAASQAAIDSHGIGMLTVPNFQEQKLFDFGTSVADATRRMQPALATRIAASITDTRELLWGILISLSRIRGSQSHLFPILIEQSGDILGFESPTPSRTLPFSLSDEKRGATDDRWDDSEEGRAMGESKNQARNQQLHAATAQSTSSTCSSPSQIPGKIDFNDCNAIQ